LPVTLPGCARRERTGEPLNAARRLLPAEADLLIDLLIGLLTSRFTGRQTQ
jgi:hypothetical protein